MLSVGVNARCCLALGTTRTAGADAGVAGDLAPTTRLAADDGELKNEPAMYVPCSSSAIATPLSEPKAKRYHLVPRFLTTSTAVTVKAYFWIC